MQNEVIDHTYTLEELLQNRSFRRWARSTASAAEKEYWDAWVMTNKENRRIAHAALLTLAGFSFDSLSGPDAKRAWDRLEVRLNKEHSGTGGRGNKRKTSRILKHKWVYRVAAGLLVILTTGLMFYLGYPVLQNQEQQTTSNQVEQEVSTGFGERKNIKLTDGSFITLNANSELVYSKDPLHPTNIKIRLQGEAFFSVVHREDPDQYPFRVQTEDGVIRVLGTEFAVSTRDSKTRVVLEKGSVEISLSDTTADTRDQTILKPSQLAELDRVNDTLVVRQVNTGVYTSWRTDKLVFDRTPLSDVLKRIEHTFGVEVRVRNSDLYNQRLSGMIENAEMSVILSTLSKVISAPIEVQSTTVYVGKD